MGNGVTTDRQNKFSKPQIFDLGVGGGKVESHIADGVIDPNHPIIEISNATGGDASVGLTLRDARIQGFKMVLFAKDAAVGEVIVVTPDNLLGYSTITFNATGESVELQFIGTNWVVIGGNGYALA